MEEQLLLGFADLESQHWWFVVRNRIIAEAISEFAPESPDLILEVGCGTGGNLRRLRDTFPDARVRGIEPSESAAEVGRGLGCEIEQGVLETLPFADGEVDLLLALDVLEHCREDDIAMAEAVRVLSPGGVFVGTVPALMSLWGPHDDRNAHFRRYRLGQLEDVVRGAGLEIERITYFNTLLLPVGYVTRVISRATGSLAFTGVDIPPAPVNALMKDVFSAEVPLLRRAKLPVGMSLLVVARRPRSRL